VKYRLFAALLGIIALLGLAPAPPLDSQIVLQRYELEMGDLKQPKTMIFSYVVSQLGATDLEQRHRIYRSGLDVRDETLAVNGLALKKKVVAFDKRDDRYAIDRVAPRLATYTMLFLHTVRDDGHVDYVYQTTPLASGGGFVVTRMTIDGERYLPRQIDFQTSSPTATGHGTLVYGKSDDYWVPMYVTIDATVEGKPARERIVWSDYRFPPELPESTFVPPKPLPHPTLPPV
jgi:hypothetical protein